VNAAKRLAANEPLEGFDAERKDVLLKFSWNKSGVRKLNSGRSLAMTALLHAIVDRTPPTDSPFDRCRI
jgi:hypothetical protein